MAHEGASLLPSSISFAFTLYSVRSIKGALCNQSPPSAPPPTDRPTIPLSLLLAVHFHFPFMRLVRVPFDVCRVEVEAGRGGPPLAYSVFFLFLSLSVPRGPPWEVGKRARMQQAPPTSLKERLLPSDLFLPTHHPLLSSSLGVGSNSVQHFLFPAALSTFSHKIFFSSLSMRIWHASHGTARCSW